MGTTNQEARPGAYGRFGRGDMGSSSRTSNRYIRQYVNQSFDSTRAPPIPLIQIRELIESLVL